MQNIAAPVNKTKAIGFTIGNYKIILMKLLSNIDQDRNVITRKHVFEKIWK